LNFAETTVISPMLLQFDHEGAPGAPGVVNEQQIRFNKTIQCRKLLLSAGSDPFLEAIENYPWSDNNFLRLMMSCEGLSAVS
jgi:hypothetical protein